MVILSAFAGIFLVCQDNKYAKDTVSVDSTIKSLYNVISGGKGVKRDWARFKNLFSPSGQLAAMVVSHAGWNLETMSPNDYITRMGPMLEREGFFETEIKRNVTKEGTLTHAFSKYESRWKAEDKTPFQAGTNAIQMYYDGTRWFIHSILWEPLAKKK